MKKWLVFVGIGILCCVIIVLAGLSNLGQVIKRVVNTYGPAITKTTVQLDDVDLALFSGSARLEHFVLGNPAGFSSEHAIRVDVVYVDVDETSLTDDTIVIDTIEVVRPDIIYEKKGGTDNFKEILENIKSSSRKDLPKQPRETTTDKSTRILIKKLIVRDGNVRLAMSALGGKGIRAPLPDVHLSDIGKENGGAPPAEVFSQIFTVLYTNITAPAVTAHLNEELKDLGLTLDKKGRAAIKGVRSAAGTVKKLFGK